MKIIKRIQVGHKMADLQRLSIEEMMAILGGKSCCYDVIAEVWSRIYGGYGIVQTPTASEIKARFTNFMNDMVNAGWNECEMDESGDPKIEQFNFLRTWMVAQDFECGSFVSGGSNGAFNFGVIPGDEKDEYHAVLVEGDKFLGGDGYYYYNVSDPNKGVSYSIRAEKLLKSMSVSERVLTMDL